VTGKLFFGTGGTPISARERSSASGVERISELGLGCMELEFVRGVRMSAETATEVKAKARELGVKLSAHAPYYVNLNAKEKAKFHASVKRILQTARVGHAAGAASIVFHPAYYMKDDTSAVYDKVKAALADIVETLRSESNPVVVRPETTGRLTAFGTLDEVINLSAELEQVLPCIDFSHLHAREGKYNTLEEFRQTLSKIESALGKPALKNFHAHVQGIKYSEKGEVSHLTLAESDFNYNALLKALKEFGVQGTVICESPNLEDDAMLLKKEYEG